MQTIIFSIVVVCLYFGTLCGFNTWIKRQDKKKLSVCLDAGIGAFLFGAFILGLALSSAIYGQPSLRAYTWILTVGFAILYCSARFISVKLKTVWVPLVCAAGTYLLHRVMPETPLNLLGGASITIVWALVMAVVMFFDRLPLLNFLTLSTWTLAFATMSVLTNYSAPQIAVLGLITMAPLWGILNILSKQLTGSFGPYASALMGFFMGGMVAVCLMSGSYGSAMTMISYYLFELFFFGLGLLGFHPFGMEKGGFAFSTVAARFSPAPVIRLVFYRLLILSLIAALMWKTNKIGILIVIILVVLLDTYNRFKVGGAAAPGIREMWKDTKEGFKQLWQNRHSLCGHMKQENTKKVSDKTPKKVVVHKRTQKVSKRKKKK